MSIYFISDLHLDPQRPAITQAFYQFLDTTAQGAESLYILGDFFETWLGDDDDTPLYQTVIQRLRAYHDQGHKLFFMRGNRDFLIGEHFALQTGATLLNDPTVIHYQQAPYLLMHGDSLCTKDDAYMAFRAQARSPQWQQDILSRSLSERRQFAEHIRKTSKTMNSLKATDIMDVSPEEVIKIMEEYGTTTLIHGHTHRPNQHKLDIQGQAAQRIVLGDWGSKGWYLCIENQQIHLISFNI